MEEVVNKYLYKNKAAEAWNRELPLPEIVQAWNVYSYLKVQRARFSQGWEAGWILKIAYFLENHTGTDDWQWCYIGNMSYRPVEMWWHTRRNQILSSCYTYGGRQFSRLLAAKVCASAVVMLDTPCSEVLKRVPATHSIRQFPLHFPFRASPCAITFQLDSTKQGRKTCALWEISW